MRGKLKILSVVAGLPAQGGGFSEIVPALAVALRENGADVVIATRAAKGEKLSLAAGTAVEKGVRIVRFASSFPRFLYFSREMLFGLRRLVAESDVVYLHGAWTFPIWWGGRCALRAGKKLVMRPAGSFNPVQLAHSRLKKKLAAIFDFALLRRADAIHVSSPTEREWVLRIRGVREERVFIVPHGVSLPEGGPLSVADPSSGTRMFLYLGRVHPMKGLDLLLGALRLFAPRARHPFRLVICGPDEGGTKARLEKQAAELGLADKVVFADPVFGEAKGRLMRSSDCVILPSRSENFGYVVAEALAYGKPVICTKGAPWQVLEGTADGQGKDGRLGWWCDVSAEGLAEALTRFDETGDEELREIARRGRTYAERELSWKGAAGKILRKFASIAEGEP